MKNRNQKKKALIFVIIIMFCVLSILIMFYSKITKNNDFNGTNTSNNVEDKNEGNKNNNFEKSLTIKEVFEKYDAILISKQKNDMEVKFPKGLFDENGNSNEDYFNKLIDELTGFIKKQSFRILDVDREIVLEALYDNETEAHVIVINGKEDFYKITNGYSYAKIENSKIVDNSNIYSTNGYLLNLSIDQMFPDKIRPYLKDEKELMNNYYSYNNGSIKIKYAPNDSVFNIIFDHSYKSEILKGVTTATPLNKVKELYPDYTMGSLEKGYLGYRNSQFYFFFHGDEVSCYAYRYGYNENFEKYLQEYLKEKDLEKFGRQLKNIFSYDVFEYNKDIQSLKVLYPTRGIEVDIKDNDPMGIKLYSNYQFSDVTKRLVKDGKISFSTNDLVEDYEMKRKGVK